MVQDILLDDTGDLRIESGDFVRGDSDPQHIVLLINCSPGSFKKHPTACVGISKYTSSVGQEATLRNDIDVKLKADGYGNILSEVQQDSSGRFDYSVSAERL